MELHSAQKLYLTMQGEITLLTFIKSGKKYGHRSFIVMVREVLVIELIIIQVI